MSSGWSSSSKSCDRGKIKKRPWTFEEDIRLLQYVKLHGPRRWNAAAKASGLQRGGKSCRLRWVNYLRPDLKRGRITPEEESQISDLHALLGNRWSPIAEKIPGRTDNEIKNFWRSRMSKRSWDGSDIAMTSPESNIPSLTSMANQTKLSNNCTPLLDVPSNAAVSEASTSTSMYQRSCEALNGCNYLEDYQVEASVNWEEDEVLSYGFPWSEQDGLTAFLYQLYLGTHDMSAYNPYTDITSLPTHPSPKYDQSDNFHDLGVTDTLWNTFPSLSDQLQMPQPPPQPEILNFQFQR